MKTKYTKKQLNEMELKQLRTMAFNLAVTYYNSDSCIISFGDRTPEQAALALVVQASKTSLIKDISSLQKMFA